MKIVVEACAHGELDKIYEAIQQLETINSFKVDLLIICGDFLAVRNLADIQCLAVPQKYKKLNAFYKYYSGEKKAPILTIFVGGNHEASNYLSELPYGGWVCPNIYYLGYANVINIGGVRIAGLSGVFGKTNDKKVAKKCEEKGNYFSGHYEFPPYDEYTKRSVYHVRNLEVFRLNQINKPIDIFISHDWPTNVYKYGDEGDLMRLKYNFKSEMDSDTLGSPLAWELLKKLKPLHWFAGHLHCKFAAVVPHDVNGNETYTNFLALGKCLPYRQFLQVIDVKSTPGPFHIEYDAEWLSILHSTNHLLSVSREENHMPGKGSSERWDFSPTDDEIENVVQKFSNDLKIPDNFTVTAPCHDSLQTIFKDVKVKVYMNPQTEKLCEILNLTDPLVKLMDSYDLVFVKQPFCDPNDIKLSDDSDDESDAINTDLCPDLDISGCSDFFIDKTGSCSTSSAGSGKSDENFSFPDIREKNLKFEAAEIKENPTKKFKRKNFDLYQSDESAL